MVDRMMLGEARFPLRFGAWVQRTHFPDWADEYGFSLAYWEIDCGAQTNLVDTELTFSRKSEVTSARAGERRPIAPAAGSGESGILTELCENRTENPPPGYVPFIW